MSNYCHKGRITVYCEGCEYVLRPKKSYCAEILKELIKALKAVSKENGFDTDLEEIIFGNDYGRTIKKGDALLFCDGETDFESISGKLQREKTAISGSFCIDRTICCLILVILTDNDEDIETEETNRRSLSYLQSILEALSGTNINSPYITRLISKNRSKYYKSGLSSYKVKDVRNTQRGERHLLEMQIDFTFHAEYDCHKVGG